MQDFYIFFLPNSCMYSRCSQFLNLLKRDFFRVKKLLLQNVEMKSLTTDYYKNWKQCTLSSYNLIINLNAQNQYHFLKISSVISWRSYFACESRFFRVNSVNKRGRPTSNYVRDPRSAPTPWWFIWSCQ